MSAFEVLRDARDRQDPILDALRPLGFAADRLRAALRSGTPADVAAASARYERACGALLETTHEARRFTAPDDWAERLTAAHGQLAAAAVLRFPNGGPVVRAYVEVVLDPLVPATAVWCVVHGDESEWYDTLGAIDRAIWLTDPPTWSSEAERLLAALAYQLGFTPGEIGETWEAVADALPDGFRSTVEAIAEASLEAAQTVLDDEATA